ncbi:MAG: hypothetical protein IAA85_03605 [Firmicutes bacterium]|nr:hypothetical protein [Candidatus Alectryobacillus merdavium]
MDKVVRWFATYWAFILLIVMVLGTAYLSALDEKKTVEMDASYGQIVIDLNN